MTGLVNNGHLDIAQRSELGVDMGLDLDSSGLRRQVLSGAVGQEDDVGLISSSLKSLNSLLHLTKMYFKRYQVKLVGSKTKLLVFNTKETALHSNVELAVTTVTVDGKDVLPTTQAAHVGVVRSVEGNSAHIMERVSAHRRAVFAILHGGSARGHRANPAATLRVEKVFCVSVLLSGLASLILSTKEEKLLDQHYKVHLQRLLKLHQATPAPVIYFLAGCLPFVAQLHLRIFSLFDQLCRLREGQNILATHAVTVFASASSS